MATIDSREAILSRLALLEARLADLAAKVSPDAAVAQPDAYLAFVDRARADDPAYDAWRARFLASYQTPAKEPAPPPPKRPRAPPFQPAVQNFKPVS